MEDPNYDTKQELTKLRDCADPQLLKLWDEMMSEGLDGGEATSDAIARFERRKKQISELK